MLLLFRYASQKFVESRNVQSNRHGWGIKEEQMITTDHSGRQLLSIESTGTYDSIVLKKKRKPAKFHCRSKASYITGFQPISAEPPARRRHQKPVSATYIYSQAYEDWYYDFFSTMDPINRCACGGTFSHSGLKNHQRTCTRSIDHLKNALAKARESRPARKRRRLEIPHHEQDTHNVGEPGGSMVVSMRLKLIKQLMTAWIDRILNWKTHHMKMPLFCVPWIVAPLTL